jgi:beta-N-acetylhexosaminidase
MMSNVTEPDWGSRPASLNPAAYAYLRGLGFDGVILTDALDAGAIRARGVDGAHAAVQAIEAGADMAMITDPSEYGPYAFEWGARVRMRGGDGREGQVMPPVWRSTRSR